jgi:hypothetical protein
MEKHADMLVRLSKRKMRNKKWLHFLIITLLDL